MPLRLDAELSIAELAKRAKVSDDTMRRRLTQAHAKHGNILIVRGTEKRKIYRSTLTLIKKAFPHLCEEPEVSRDDVEDLQAKVIDLEKRMNAMAAANREFQKKAYAWFTERRK